MANDVTKPRDVLPRYMAMGTWKAKKLKNGGKKSQTPGRQKNPETCQADAMKKFMARSSRSYKHPQYAAWCAQCDKINPMGVKR